MITGTSNVYIWYDLFILFGTSVILTKKKLYFLSAIKTVIMVEDDLDYCKHIDAGSHLWKSCYKIVVEKKIL